jgi:hypothetical protein
MNGILYSIENGKRSNLKNYRYYLRKDKSGENQTNPRQNNLQQLSYQVLNSVLIYADEISSS